VTDLLGPAEIRRLAETLGIRPTKRLGQNFVHDPNTVRRIVAAAGLVPGDVVLEVGPGLGSLTCALLPAVSRVHAVEIDEVLAAQLPHTVAEKVPGYADRLSVHNADALRIRAADFDPAPSAMVANLPYNVAVPVLLHAFAELPTLCSALVMVQAEVADRIVAGPGSRVYGTPSVKTAWFAGARRAGSVPRSVFWPVPGVDSALVALRRRPPPADVPRERVFSVIDAAFSTRRKMLRSALAGWAGSAEQATRLLVEAGVDPATRGEQLDVTQFAKIAATCV
jgi:16S rRNA (adenine1518-N6/adenine1519-N6)-dimethyltransferase